MKLKLKIAGALLAVQLAVACSAQTSHVTTAYSLYKACFQGTLQAQQPWARGTMQPEELAELMNYVDQNCLVWTQAWYPAFTNNKDVTELRQDEVVRFNRLRFDLIDRAISELKTLLSAAKK